MDEQDLLERIQSLVEEEHRLRDAAGSDDGDSTARLAQLEAQLDQCWDLLRQRRAKRDAGENPDSAEPRPISEVEGYRQ
ncbi:DUF2630 family protein [Paenarthrobacter aurescens]|uniref:DUF2630 domain-containing protein n=1 Tax=Paenarthrobacter aurescens TaxID=43663 RepID=A0A4Y3NIP1_PAEAU|nr:DUF2630 family protein [Paenarthrobacter aurescens]UKA50032.1 DUF2630 family protein [Arthrobacter sp. FW305-123]MDO6141760.1 DUF2630 family protein [Paenarthrobacter aurescens]MDO6149523.1 DUF2630 family protein [Paenarthrobacter aurescens]MDO6156809.1 DUF2630 family protein [Paenarthrobacter aurescens]MDO6160795.1 DUF2630 family protein [Paenarthrobacter aurescens]